MVISLIGRPSIGLAKMQMLQVLPYVVFVTIVIGFGVPTESLHPDAGLNIIELVTKYGYPIESHQVQTEDGYILTMHRIPHGVKSTNMQNKPPVLFMHSLLCSSVDWVNMGPKKALGFLLADAGYDVWLGNQRGNTWSRHHVTLDPDLNATEFFDFSFHEIGIYDIPAKIDYIQDVTKQEKLFYIGHSQGVTSFLIMASEKPEYNNRIKLMTALGPAVYMSNLFNPFVRFAAFNYGIVNKLVELFNVQEFMPHYRIITKLGLTLCAQETLGKLCSVVIFCFAGFDFPQLAQDFVPVIITNAPAGSAVKQSLHYFQGVNSGNFSQYDHGVEENLRVYGQATPPHYDFSKVTAPISLHYAQGDWLVSPLDVEKLAQRLPNLVTSRLVPLPKFNHLDFIWAIDVVELVYNDVIAEMKAIN